MTYRVIRASDMDFLCDLYASTRAQEMRQVPWSEAEKQAFLTMQFQAQHAHYQAHYPNAEWLIVLQAEHRIGRLYLETWDSELRIIDIAVLPPQRSRGIGTAILGDLIDEAQAAGRSVTIHVEKSNPAQRLYRRLGFETVSDKGVYDLLEWSDPADDQVNSASY